MFATLFFDSTKTNTSVLVRQRPDDDDVNAESTKMVVPYEGGSVSDYEGGLSRTPYTPSPHAPSYVYQSFTCHGSEPIPELHATLLWWLDDNRDASSKHASSSAAAMSSQNMSGVAGPAAPLLVHLLLVDDSESAGEAHHSQSRMLTVKLPIVGGRQALLTCGVSRLAVGGHCVAVAWMSRDLCAGFVRVTLQRTVNRASTLLLTSQGSVVQAEPLVQLQRTFRDEVWRTVQAQAASAGRAVVMSDQAGATAAASEFSAEHWMLVSGCVLSTIPVEEREAMAFFILTSGTSVWRVQLYENGTTSLAIFTDPKHRRDATVLLGRQLTADNGMNLVGEFEDILPASEIGSGRDAATSSSSSSPRPDGSRSRWLARWVRGDGHRGGTVATSASDGTLSNGGYQQSNMHGLRRYLTVSAVSGSTFLTLVRSTGHIELLAAADFSLVERYAICRLPVEQARSLHRAAHTTEVVQQWAALDYAGRCVHMLTCLGTQDNRRCIRSMVPAVVPNADNRLAVAVQCCYGLVPPTLMSSPISAAVDASGRRLLVLWDTGVEEDAHLVNVHSAMSLADAAGTGRARYLAQIVESELTPLGALALQRTSAFICHNAGIMQAALAQENSFVVVNKHKASHAAYVLQPAAHPLAMLVEGTLIANDNESDPIAWPTTRTHPATASAMRTAAALSFVPTVEAPMPAMMMTEDGAGPHAVPSPFEGFCEGVTLLNTSPQAATLLAVLLESLFSKLTPQTQLALLPRVVSEAYLNGYTPSGFVTNASVVAAVKLALSAQGTTTITTGHIHSNGGDQDILADGLALLGSSAVTATPLLESTPCGLFCRFGRLYLQQRVVHDLRQRIVFLLVTMLGDAAAARADTTQSGGTASALLTATLTQLLAAYHAVVVAGPELTNVLDAVHEDVVESLLSFLLFPFQGVSDAWTGTTATSPPHSGRAAVNNEEQGELEQDAAVMGPSRAAVRVAARFARCHTPRCTKACLAWCVLLKPLYPILYHFDAVFDLSVGRTTNSTQILAVTMRVAEALAQLSVTEATAVLVDDGLLLADDQNSTCFSGIPTTEVVRCLAAYPALAPKLYVTGLLRRATPNGSLQAALSESVVRRFFLSELYHVWRAVRAANDAESPAGASALPASASASTSGGDAASGMAAMAPLRHSPFPILQLALEELRVDVLFCLALASLDRGAVDLAFHDLQSALDAAMQLGVANAYTDVVHYVVHQAVEIACGSPAGVHALTVVSIESPQLRDLVVHRWYNTIARLPTKSASAATEARRFRAIMGLYRFLLNQHAYAQCGRVMTDLATLLRCSPLRMATSATTHISVGELANMALSAVLLIDPVGPVITTSSTSARAVDQEHGALAPTSALFGSPVSLGHSWAALGSAGGGTTETARSGVAPGVAVGQRRWLSRADIPMLQRRVYQAHCERMLWSRGSTLNCTDIWVEGVREADFERGVERLLEALMQHRLWEEAYRFATLAPCSDPCAVLAEWVTDLLKGRRHVETAYAGGYLAFHEAEEEEEGFGEMQYQWQQLIRCCQESSTLHNQFRAFCVVVSAALTFDYGATMPMLPYAHCEADAYTALVTLIEVIEHFRRENERLSLAANVEGTDEALDAAGQQRADKAAHAGTTRWLVWQDAVVAATALLRGQQKYQATPDVCITMGFPGRAANGELTLTGFTAGVFDPLARYSKELLAMPSSVSRVALADPALSGATQHARDFLEALNALE